MHGTLGITHQSHSGSPLHNIKTPSPPKKQAPQPQAILHKPHYIKIKQLNQVQVMTPSPHLQTRPSHLSTSHNPPQPYTHLPASRGTLGISHQSYQQSPPHINKTPAPPQKQALHPHPLHKPPSIQIKQLKQAQVMTPSPHLQSRPSHLSPPHIPPQPYTHPPASRVAQKDHVSTAFWRV
ncbi:extensin-like [Carassius auratus]|uniref:Extensin-like n=1 Tax=Carassius auratus TaxID=7957 RepID=A0A6P6J1Q4_CARAU|nr:extensin-like [Carassius auratus]